MPETLQDDWTENATPPPAKKGLPSWLLFCGGGCLIAMILSVAGVYMLYDTFKDTLNPEVQWAELEKVVELDARPNDLRMGAGVGLAGIDAWMLADGIGHTLIIMANPSASAEERSAAFSEELEGGGFPGISSIDELELMELSIQGRTVPFARFTANTQGQSMPSCMVDITPEGDVGFVMAHVQWTRAPEGETISEDTIRGLLKAFVIGPDREVYIPDGPHPQAGQTSFDLESLGQTNTSFEYEILEEPTHEKEGSSDAVDSDDE